MGRTFVSFEEASQLLKCTKRTIHNFIKRGQLRRAYEEGQVVLHRAEVEQLADERGSGIPALNNRTLLECLSRIKDLELQLGVFKKMSGIEAQPALRPIPVEAAKLVENVRYYLGRDSFESEEINFWCGIFRRIDENTLDLIRAATGKSDFWQDVFNLCMKIIDYVSDTKRLKSVIQYEHHLELNETKKRLREVFLMWVELRGIGSQHLRKHLGTGRDDLVERLTRQGSKS